MIFIDSGLKPTISRIPVSSMLFLSYLKSGLGREKLTTTSLKGKTISFKLSRSKFKKNSLRFWHFHRIFIFVELLKWWLRISAHCSTNRADKSYEDINFLFIQSCLSHRKNNVFLRLWSCFLKVHKRKAI